ncbi:MAG: hypothetical protein LBF66_00365 [Holosporales bacterium]|jgi:hypothetical protein|nr:hypothetical protein [Holosporales bacterium]
MRLYQKRGAVSQPIGEWHIANFAYVQQWLNNNWLFVVPFSVQMLGVMPEDGAGIGGSECSARAFGAETRRKCWRLPSGKVKNMTKVQPNRFVDGQYIALPTDSLGGFL